MDTRTSFPTNYDYESNRIDIDDILNNPEYYITKDLVLSFRKYNDIIGKNTEYNFMAISALNLKIIFDEIDMFLNRNQTYLNKTLFKELVEFQYMTNEVGLLDFYNYHLVYSENIIGSPDNIIDKHIYYIKKSKNIIEMLEYKN